MGTGLGTGSLSPTFVIAVMLCGLRRAPSQQPVPRLRSANLQNEQNSTLSSVRFVSFRGHSFMLSGVTPIGVSLCNFLSDPGSYCPKNQRPDCPLGSKQNRRPSMRIFRDHSKLRQHRATHERTQQHSCPCIGNRRSAVFFQRSFTTVEH